MQCAGGRVAVVDMCVHTLEVLPNSVVLLIWAIYFNINYAVDNFIYMERFASFHILIVCAHHFQYHWMAGRLADGMTWGGYTDPLYCPVPDL